MCPERLNGLYLITDDTLTPLENIETYVYLALEAGVKIIQLRTKTDDMGLIKEKAISLRDICRKYDALFVINDYIDLAIEEKIYALHIGESDYHRFDDIRSSFDGILGVSCYGNIQNALDFQNRGADYVAFGSFFQSPTKPNSNIVPLDTLMVAKSTLNIPICAIGGINIENLLQITQYKPNMICVINDIWSSTAIDNKIKEYITAIKETK